MNSDRLTHNFHVEIEPSSDHTMDRPSPALAEFRGTVSKPHMRIPWTERLRSALFFVEQHPTTAITIGLIPTEDGFLMNSTACAAFFGVKRKSWNINCQQHGLFLDARFDVCAEIREKHPTLKGEEWAWQKRRFIGGRFNGQSRPNEVDAVIEYGRRNRYPPLAEMAMVEEKSMGGSGFVDESGPTVLGNPSNEREWNRAEDGGQLYRALDLDLCPEEDPQFSRDDL
jgi:hypothetical protein